MTSNSGAREAKNRPRNNIASSIHEKKKKTEVCTKILKIEFEEVCSVFVLDLDFSCYLDGYVLGNSKRRGNFLLVRKLRVLTGMVGVGALVLFEFATLLRESWTWNFFNTDGGINFIEFWMV